MRGRGEGGLNGGIYVQHTFILIRVQNIYALSIIVPISHQVLIILIPLLRKQDFSTWQLFCCFSISFMYWTELFSVSSGYFSYSEKASIWAYIYLKILIWFYESPPPPPPFVLFLNHWPVYTKAITCDRGRKKTFLHFRGSQARKVGNRCFICTSYQVIAGQLLSKLARPWWFLLTSGYRDLKVMKNPQQLQHSRGLIDFLIHHWQTMGKTPIRVK